MATTPTNKPIPSEDPRDLKFNAGKIDEEVNGSADYYTDRFGVQRLTNTGRNNQFQDAQTQRESDFVASQADKEARFQQFLLNSGYQFLGDYENGPFQFSARNQYIRYDNQYYRLNAATDVGFTTTGTDATSFANDVTHFVLMDGDTLRQDLGSGDGFKLLGMCETVNELRTVEPSYPGQVIKIRRAVSGGPILNAEMFYDDSDTSSSDNDFSVFVTPGGARWKPCFTDGINAWMAGFSESENNLAECINKIGQWYVDQSISDVQINNRKAIIYVPGLGYKTTYTITSTIKLPPSLVELRPMCDMVFDFSASPGLDGIVCSHEYSGLTSGKGNSQNGDSADAGGAVINPIGVLYLKGPGITKSKDGSGNVTSSTSSTGVGLVLGNRTRISAGAGYLNVRDAHARNVRIFGFMGGFQFGNYDTYLVTLSESNLYSNLHNHYQPNVTVTNTGEGMYFDRVTVSNAGINNHYIDANGLDYWFKNTHIDYAYQDGVFFGPNAATEMVLTDCWVEGNDRYVFAQPTKTGTSGQCRILMQGGKIVPNRYGVTYRGVRPIFKSTVFNAFILELMDVDLNGGPAGYMCDDAYGSWCPLNDQTVLTIGYRTSDTYKWLPRFRYGIGGYLLNSNFQFTGTAGAALPTSVTAADAASAYHWVATTGSPTVVYGAAGDADSDGYIPVKITATSTSDVVYLYCGNYVQFPRNGIYMYEKCSVKCGSATGDVNVQAALRPLTYRSVNSTLNTSTNAIANTYTETSLGTVTGDSIGVISEILVKTYLTVTANDYVSTPPLKIQNYFRGSLWGNPGLKFTGFVGTIYVKLPAYWFSGIHPNW
jgi:hypothetical protein